MREFKRGAMGLVGTGAAPGEGGGTRGRSTAGAALCVAAERRRWVCFGRLDRDPTRRIIRQGSVPLFLFEGRPLRAGPACNSGMVGGGVWFPLRRQFGRCVCSMRSCLTKNVLIRGVYFLGLFLTAGGGRNDNNGRVCVSLFIMCFPDWWLDQWMGIFISSWELGGEGRGLGAIP